MDDYLTKPFITEQLRLALSRVTLDSKPRAAIPSPVKDVLNRARLTQLCSELNPQVVHEIMGDFISSLPDNLTELKQLGEARNWVESERAAHSMKGVAASFGFDLLSAKLNDMEEAASKSDDKKSKRLLAELEPLGRLATEALKQWLETADITV
jgi:HPt (histidine-containing phosphotransfer) domain-containing protein